jgi:transcriptional regulator with XRE-family HTH domain
VKGWLPIGEETMISARKARGLSREALGSLIHVTSKTVERWELRGAVPRADLENYAQAVGLDIETPEPVKIKLPPIDDAQTARIEARLAEVSAKLDELERLLLAHLPADATDE